MNLLISFLKLIRINNLILIALGQILFQYFVLRPMFYAYYLPVTLPHLQFFLLVLATLLIAAGGNIINDIFDLEVDLYNKPEKVIIDKTISESAAQNIYYLFNGIALGLVIYLTKYIGNLQLISYFVLCFVLLWFYSSELKKKPVIGNFVIGLLGALSIIIVWLFERNLFNPEWLAVKDMQTVSPKIFMYAVTYSMFAMLTNFIREIIKDIEDRAGDEKYGAQTLVIKYGMKTTKAVLSVFYLIFIALALYIINYFMAEQAWNKLSYAVGAILLPFLCSGYFIILRENARLASVFIKVTILTGVLSMFFF